MAIHIRRREFIFTLGGAAAWPLAVKAQQPNRTRKIGVLMGIAQSDPEARRRFAVFAQALQDMSWTDRQNIAFEMRYADGKPERLPSLAAELVQANVDVIVTQAAQPVEAARNATSTIPIVMAAVGDAVGAGYVVNEGSRDPGQDLWHTGQLAKMVGVPVGTVRNWEHGRRKPTGPARVLLRLLDSDPEIVTVLLRRVDRIERAQTAQPQFGD